jgi:hypothetical protein
MLKMKLNKNWWIAILLCCCVFGESMAFTYVQQEGQDYFYSSSILYLFTGILVCILPLFGAPASASESKENTWRKYLPLVFSGFLIFLVIYHVYNLLQLYQKVPISVDLADMIPVIRLSCKRLLHGIPVYSPTPEIWPGSVNAYLPMMWLPYLPAEVFGYDYRWTTFGVFFISIFVAAIPVFKAAKSIRVVPMVLACVSLFLTLNFCLFHFTTFWSMSEEGVVAGFYILLSYALLRQNYYLAGLTMAFCLLSRYALVPWIPVYFAFVFFTEPRNNFKKLAIAFIVPVLLIFVLPYFIWDPFYFLGLPGVQAKSLEQFWLVHGLDRNAYVNVGLYKFFDFTHARQMMTFEAITSLVMPVLFILLALKLQKRYQFSSRFIAYGSLKLSLVFFFNFIPTPYYYLFFPVTLISYVLLFDFIAGNVVSPVSINEPPASYSQPPSPPQ